MNKFPRPIIKYNSGIGAILCNECRVIIKTNLTKDECEGRTTLLFCDNHYKKYFITMRKLNLVNRASSEVSFRIIRYPDGQQDIQIDLGDNKDLIYAGIREPVMIMSRFNSFLDLELIICATKALKRLGTKEIHLFVPYLLGGRSDRQFVEGGTSYLREVVAPIINNQDFTTVSVLDPHSNTAKIAVNNLVLIDNRPFVEFVVDNIGIGSDLLFVAPDKGSETRVKDFVSKWVGADQESIIHCSKKRDADGKIISTEIDYKGIAFMDKDIVIIDDICDGGKTFIEIARKLNEDGHYGKKYLVVSHGIFSRGFEELGTYFDRVFSTDSVVTKLQIPEYIQSKSEFFAPKVFNIYE